MADIDSLEIQISSDSSQAAESISALVSSLGRLEGASVRAAESLTRLSQALGSLKDLTINTGIQGSLTSLENAVSAIPRISSILKGAKISESSYANIENLGRSIQRLNDISAPEQFVSAVQSITSASEQLGQMDIGNALTNILRLSPAMEKLDATLSGLSTAQSRFTNMTATLQKFADKIGAISEIDVGNADKVQEFLNKILNVEINDETTKRIETLAQAVSKVTNAKPNEAAADALRLLIDTVRILTDEDIERLRELSTLMKGLSGFKMPEMPKADSSIKETGDAASKTSEELGYMDEIGARIAESLPSAFRRVADSAKTIINAIGRGGLKVISAELKAITAPIRAVGNAFKNAAKKVSDFMSSVKRILLYRAIRTMLKSISQGLQEGRENLYQYSVMAGTEFAKSMDKAATSFLYLKNSIGAATAPLTNYLVPVLEHIIDVVVEVINGFNELTAALTGASTWTKALKYPVQWQEAADDANKSAKALKTTMLGFDELNVIEPKQSGSGSSGSDDKDYSKMFTEVKTNFQQESGLSELVIPVKFAWGKEGQATLQSIKGAIGETVGLFGDIGGSFREVWLNGTGQQTLETILSITQNIAGTWTAITAGIRKAWNEGGRGTRIIQNLWSAGNNVLTVVNDIWSGIKKWAEGLNWEPLFNGFEQLSKSIKKLTDPNGALAKITKAVWTDFLQPVGTVLIEEALPAVIMTLSMVFDDLGEVLEALEPIFEKVVTWLGKIAVGAIDAMSAVLTSIVGINKAQKGEEIPNEVADKAFSFSKSLHDAIGSAYDDWEKFWGDIAYNHWWSDRANGETAIDGATGLMNWITGVNDDLLITRKEGRQTAAEYYYNQKYASKYNTRGKTPTPVGARAEDYYNTRYTQEAVDAITQSQKELLALERQFGEYNSSNGFPIESSLIREAEHNEKADWYARYYGGIQTEVSSLPDTSESYRLKQEPTYYATSGIGLNGNEMISVGNFDSSLPSVEDSKKADWYASYYGASGKTAQADYSQAAYGAVPDEFTETYVTGMETVSDKFDSFKKDWKSGWNDIGEWTSSKWSKITSAFSSGWQSVKSFFSNFGSNWKSGWEDIKTSAGEKWDAVKTKLGTGWETLKGKVSDWKENWVSGMKDIRDNVREKWDAAKEKLQEGWTDIRNKLFTWKEEWKSGMKVIEERVHEKWDAAKGKLLEGWSNIKGKLTDWKDTWVSGLATIKKEAHEKWDNVKSHLESGWSTVVKKVTDYFDNWNQGFKDIKNWLEKKVASPIQGAWDKVVGTVKSILPFANGGTVDSGQLFIAREAGAELVGNIGGTTAVMNNQQIVQAVSSGVAQAVSSVMSQMLAMQNGGANNGDITVTVNLDGRQIAASVEKAQKRRGVSILGGVYNAT